MDIRLLPEIEELIRSLPSDDQLQKGGDQILAWRGRASATIGRWNPLSGGVRIRAIWSNLDSSIAGFGMPESARNQLMVLLHEARHSILLETPETSDAAFTAGAPFAYFNQLAGVIRLAQSDILFCDPYLEETFVARYLPLIASGATIRLLCSKTPARVKAAVEVFVQQNKVSVEVRAGKFHDRFIFIDRKTGWQSSASFKDGARNDPATIIEIVDVLEATLGLYDDLWAKGAPVFP